MLMLIGLHFMTFGFRVFRGTLALVGFTVFGEYYLCLTGLVCHIKFSNKFKSGIVTWIGLTNGEPAGGYPHRDIIYVTVIIGLGLLGAIVFMYFWCFSIYLIGGTYLTGSSFSERLVHKWSILNFCSGFTNCLYRPLCSGLMGFLFAIFVLSWKQDLVITNVKFIAFL